MLRVRDRDMNSCQKESQTCLELGSDAEPGTWTLQNQNLTVWGSFFVEIKNIHQAVLQENGL